MLKDHKLCVNDISSSINPHVTEEQNTGSYSDIGGGKNKIECEDSFM